MEVRVQALTVLTEQCYNEDDQSWRLLRVNLFVYTWNKQFHALNVHTYV